MNSMKLPSDQLIKKHGEQEKMTTAFTFCLDDVKEVLW